MERYRRDDTFPEYPLVKIKLQLRQPAMAAFFHTKERRKQMIDITKTFTTPDDYELIKGVNLTEELVGSTDHDEKAGQLMIYRVERNMINWLTYNRDFTKDMITTNESTRESFVHAVCDQIEWFIDQGILTPTAVDEYMQQHKVFICESAEFELKTHGLANWRTC